MPLESRTTPANLIEHLLLQLVKLVKQACNLWIFSTLSTCWAWAQEPHVDLAAKKYPWFGKQSILWTPMAQATCTTRPYVMTTFHVGEM